MRKFFRDMLTGPDNETYDLVHFIILMSWIAYVFYSWYHLKDDNVFSPKEFSEGVTMLLVGSGIAAGAKTLAEGKAKC